MSNSSFVYNCVGRRPAESASPFSSRKEKMRTIFIVPVLLAAFAAPAWASQCPRSIAALDDMLRQHGSMLSPDKATEVKALRNKAEQAHAAGKQDESLQAVKQNGRTSCRERV